MQRLLIISSVFLIHLHFCALAWSQDRSEVLTGLGSYFHRFESFDATNTMVKVREGKEVDPINVQLRLSPNRAQFIRTKRNEETLVSTYEEFVDTNDIAEELHVRWEGFVPEDEGKKELPPNVQVDLLVHSQTREFPYRARLPLHTGWISGEKDSIVDILRDGKNWTSKTVSHHGYDCEEVTVDHSNGTFSVVFCPSLDYSVLEIRVKKNGAHSHRDGPLQESGISEYSRTYRYREFDPAWKECVVESLGTIVRNGVNESNHRVRYWKFKSHQLADDHIQLNYEIPEGTPVSLRGQRQINAMWKDDQLVLPYDTAFVEKLESSHFLTETEKPAPTNAADNDSPEPSKTLTPDASYYCGIYSIYGAACALEQKTEFQELLSDEYVSGFRGSSITDLEKAAEKLNIRLKDFKGLGVNSLLSAKDPLILHVASSGQLIAYNHWVLFLGCENGKARILDSRNGVRLIPFGRLCARWDGIALAAYRGDKPQVDYAQIELKTSFVRITCAALLILIGTYFIKSRYTGFLSGLIVFGIASTVFVVYGASQQHSVLRDTEANDYLFAVLEKKQFDLVSLQDLVSALEEDEPPYTLVDARRQRSFARGSIPTAINLPVDISEADLEALVLGIAKTEKIVVFCAHSNCSFDDVVAMRLSALGFHNIKVYEGGYREWLSPAQTAK